MRVFLIRLLLLVAVALPAAAARGADLAFPDLAEPVPGAEGVTYIELARHVFPDLQPRDGAYAGSKVIETRHLGGTGFAATPPAEFALYGIAALPVRSDGRDRLALLFDLGDSVDSAEGFAILALYELGGAPVLLDAAQVGFDRSTYFRDPAALALNAENELLLTMSAHFNSSQGYVTSSMILARGGKLELIDTVFTFDDRGCGFERLQMPDFSTEGGATLANVVVLVTETIRHTGDGCVEQQAPPEGARAIVVTYRWDAAAARFVPDSDALEVLARENQARF